MRLNQKYLQTIKQAFKETFKKGEVYLFGSRVDKEKKGGDIDLYLIVDEPTLKNKLKFLAKIKKILGDQKIDVVFQKDKNRLIEKEALKWGKKIIEIS
ncbi:nucleotidyltransferase domain-containing protein [Caminibacter pacificus]